MNSPRVFCPNRDDATRGRGNGLGIFRLGDETEGSEDVDRLGSPTRFTDTAMDANRRVAQCRHHRWDRARRDHGAIIVVHHDIAEPGMIMPWDLDRSFVSIADASYTARVVRITGESRTGAFEW